MIRTFQLNRSTDSIGVSGTGVVAYGVIFPSGKVALSWQGEISSVVIHDNIENVEKVHCYGGHTKIEMCQMN